MLEACGRANPVSQKKRERKDRLEPHISFKGLPTDQSEDLSPDSKDFTISNSTTLENKSLVQGPWKTFRIQTIGAESAAQ